MRRFGRVLRVVFPLLLIGVFALVGQVVGDVDTAGGGDKSFELEEIEVTALLKRNGVLLVREEVTYDFDGTFTVGTRDFDAGPWEIRNIRAFEDGRRLPTLLESPTLFEWDIAPASGVHTYELRYEVHNAVLAWPDVAELNWQWVGPDVPEPVGRHTVRLRVPGEGEGVRAWAHGPLSGTIEVDGGRIRTEIEDLPAYTFLETRVVVPRGRFGPDLFEGREGRTEPRDYITECDFYRRALEAEPTLTPRQREQFIRDYAGCRGEAPVETSPQLPRIIEEETALAEEANAARAEFQREQEEKEDRRRALNVAWPFVVGITLLAGYLVWRKWGREPEIPDIDYWREVPDDPPAVAIALLQWGYVDTDAFSATVVDLAQRGYLTIEEKEKDHTFTATDKSQDGLLDFERKVLTRLFSQGPETSQKQLTDWAKSHRSNAAAWLSSFTSQVQQAYNAKGYQVKGQVTGWLLYALLVVVLGLYAAAAIYYEAYAAAGGAIGAGVVLLATMVLLRRRTPAGAQRHGEWEGLRRFLKDFSQLEDAPSGHMALYERYLVAAVALGVADELVEALEVRMPQLAGDPGFAPWYVGTRTGRRIGGFHSIGDFSSGFSSATASSFRPPSSSGSSGGGGGGGFSGGGGGGGGGGGFGAR